MVHTTEEHTRENFGSRSGALHTIDITGLDGANYEEYAPDAEVGADIEPRVDVVGLENPGTYIVQWDHVNERLHVEQYGGTDPAAGTAVGEVQLRVTWG